MKKLVCSLLAAGFLALLAAIAVSVAPAAAGTGCDNCGHIIGGHAAPTKAGGNDNCVALCGLEVTRTKAATKTDCPPGDPTTPDPGKAIDAAMNQMMPFGNKSAAAAGSGCPPVTSGGATRTSTGDDGDPGTNGSPGGKPKYPGPLNVACAKPGIIYETGHVPPPCPTNGPNSSGGPHAHDYRQDLAYRDCEAQLRRLRSVSEREVRSVDRGDTIRLIPICDNLQGSLTQTHRPLAGRGNAASLLPAIARNYALGTTLRRASYNPEDVVGIAMATSQVVLYVQHQ